MYEYRRATRPADRRAIAGVATGLADHFAIPVWWVQAGFVVATWLQGLGIVAYLLLWRFMPLARPEESPGLEAATRNGMRSWRGPGGNDIARTVALLAVAAGGVALLGRWGWTAGGFGSGGAVLPLLAAVAGIALIWRQIDDATMADWLRQTKGPGYWARMIAGAVLVVVAVGYLIGDGRGWRGVADLVAAVVIVAIGVALILGPRISGMWAALEGERRERIRSEERADMAAHLHDSVLQTLALLQRNAGDPATVATLARRQERELRAWLYDSTEAVPDTVAAALRAAAQDVELTHNVAIETVTVGDAPMTEAAGALVGASREALVNAAKHAGVDRVDLYAELNAHRAEVFVRDRGKGFDPESVPDDRQGLRGSVIERIERQGGTAEVRSASGAGTEVHLVLPVTSDEED